MKQNLLSVTDLTAGDIAKLYRLTYQIKDKYKKNIEYMPLTGKALAMIFHKPSTRTSASFAVGMYQLGGLPLIFNAQDLQLRRGESLADTARVFSRYVHGLLVRAKVHQDVVELAKYSDIPVINGLTDLEHPCQVLSDVYTVLEKKKWITTTKLNLNLLKSLNLVFIGDGSNNIANSLILLSSILGIKLTICAPRGYGPSAEILNNGQKIANTTGAKIMVNTDPKHSVKNADAIYTDVWVSMGQEEEAKKRCNDLRPYQINSKLLNYVDKDCYIMHCLPARRGEEITNEVIDGKNSIVFDQAENRLHLQKAILVTLLNKR